MKNFILKYKYTVIYFIVITLLTLYFEPYQEKFYLKADIKKFEDEYYWKIIFIIILIFFIFLIRFIFKKKERKITDHIFPMLNITLYTLFLAFIFQYLIISIVLFSNRTINRSQSQIIYKVKYYKELNYTIIINETKTDTIINTFEGRFFNTLESIRLKKKLKKINISDTINVKYGIGLMGIKYLKE